MFGFFKDKLKSALSVFSKKVDEESKEVEVEAPEESKSEGQEEVEKNAEKKEEKKEAKKEGAKEHKAEKKKGEKKVEKKEEKKEVKKEAVKESKKSAKKEESKAENKEENKLSASEEKKELRKEELKEEEIKTEPIAVEIEVEKSEVQIPAVEVKQEVKEEKKGFFAKIKGAFISETPVVQEVQKIQEEVQEKGFFTSMKEKITTKVISVEQFDELFWDVELVLLENNVAVAVIEKIKADLKRDLVGKPLPRSQIQDSVLSALKNSVSALFDFPSFDLIKLAGSKKPFVICIVGVNGSGKTTTIAKLANFLQKNGLSCVIAAADTFRAAAIDQLQLHADKLNVKLVKHDYGADAAAVAFDAIKHAEAKNKDVVLIDTAGRLHSNVNLMDEMKKIIRVAKPDLKLFVGESITGNDCVEQARLFDEAVGIDGIVLSKADIDEKGGAALSVSYVTKKPILYLGVGQEYGDLELFEAKKMVSRLGL